ncbi:kelch-like protein 3 [Oculina patagonica]
MASSSQHMSADPSQHHQELIERLDILRTNQSFCDVTVAVKDKEFKAHKVVLAAASPFIRSLLASDMRESKEQLIKIELEEATASVMEAVLQYVYTGNVLVTEESAHNLIATADYLFLPGLKTMACNFLKDNVTLENCIFIYYFADKYRCVELGENAREVINSNFSAVMETEDFLSLDMKQVMEWVSSDDVTVNAEEDIFKGIVKRACIN